MKTPLAFWRRYLRMFIKYGSFKKYINLVLSFIYYLKGSPKISTMPSFFKCEISRQCFIHCKYCTEKKENIFFPLDFYKKLIDRLKDYIFLVSLYDIGEPLHNKDLLEYIKYAHARKIGTIISTSLSLKKPDIFWRDLILSGLDRIIIAIDGISEETYKRYRTNGDLGLVLSNLDKLITNKAKFNKPITIEWQMIDLPWNKTEQQAALRMATQLKVDEFRIIPDASVPRSKYAGENVIRKRNCLLPFIIFIVNAYNQVRPCYKIYKPEMIIGDLYDRSFEEMWNSAAIGEIRDKNKIKHRVHCSNCQE